MDVYFAKKIIYHLVKILNFQVFPVLEEINQFLEKHYQSHLNTEIIFVKLNFTFSFTAHISSPTTASPSEEKEPAKVDKILKLLPSILQPYKDVFDEVSANMLPPHRQYDCEIKLKPNSILYYGPIYPLTDAESKALKEYIEENLAKGFIRKSKSPAGAPVFFVFKKNGELRMVVDYRKLNEITIRDSYPLPLLINDMLEHLGKAKYFLNLIFVLHIILSGLKKETSIKQLLLELLAIIDSLENWKHFLKGATHPFVIYSDHRNLLYQKKPEKMTQRLVRWSLFLSEFNFKIEYRSGSSNGKPDALSRRPDFAINDESSTSDIPFSVLRPENFTAIASIVSSLNDRILQECKDDDFYRDI
eukprot:jgi/Orpsp1_1/1188171/evm.model.d7180000062949.1